MISNFKIDSSISVHVSNIVSIQGITMDGIIHFFKVGLWPRFPTIISTNPFPFPSANGIASVNKLSSGRASEMSSKVRHYLLLSNREHSDM
jgi:hypothetical protein